MSRRVTDKYPQLWGKWAGLASDWCRRKRSPLVRCRKDFFFPPQTWMSQWPAPQTRFPLKSPANWPTSLENFENTFMAIRRARNGALGLPSMEKRGLFESRPDPVFAAPANRRSCSGTHGESSAVPPHALRPPQRVLHRHQQLLLRSNTEEEPPASNSSLLMRERIEPWK